MIAKLSRGVLISLVGLVIGGSSAMADTGQLITLLSSRLGVTEQQASGGAGSIFRLAQSRLQPAQFRQIAERIPGLDGLIAGAPAPAAKTSRMPAGIENMNTAAGGAASSAASAQTTRQQDGATAVLQDADRAHREGLSPLAQPFAQLGMQNDRVEEFVPIVLDYTRAQAGESAMRLLQGALIDG
jgi:hypothetical protein